MIDDYNSQNQKLVTDKLTGNTAAYMGFVTTGSADRYVPNTVLKIDIRDYISNQVRVLAVYRKPMDTDRYEKATYFAKKIDWDAVTYSEQYSYL